MAEGSENTVEFLLKTRAELSGAQQLAASLEQQIGKAKALGKDYSDLQKQLDQVDASIKASTAANADLAAAEKESADAAEFMHKNHRAMHMLFHEMGSESVPALGHAMGAMMMGPVGPAIALLAIFGALKSSFEGWQENLDKAAEDNANANFAGGIEAMNTALGEGMSKIDAYAAAIEKISQHEVTIAQALASQLQSMRALAEERERARKAAEAAANAETERQQKAGEITPEQAELKQAAAAIQAAKDAAAAKKKNAEDEINAQQDAIEKAAFKQDQLTADYEAKQKAFTEADAHRKRIEKDFGPDSEQTVVLNQSLKTEEDGIFGQGRSGPETKKLKRDEAIAAATEELTRQQETFEKLQKAFDAGGTVSAKVLEDAKQNLLLAQGQLQNLLRGKGQYIQATSSESDSDLQAKQRAATTAADKGTENAKFIDEAKRKLDQQRADMAAAASLQAQELSDQIAAILSKTVEKLYSLPHGAEVQQGVKFSDDIEKALRAAALGNQYQRTQNISEDDARFLMKFVNEHGGNAQTVQQSSQFAVDKWGNLNAHDTTDITEQNKSQFNQAEIFLVQLANDLGAHVKNVKDAADFVSKLKDNTSAFFDAVIQMANNGFTAQQKQLDSLFVKIQQIQETANNH
jgi:hypothetical protein